MQFLTLLTTSLLAGSALASERNFRYRRWPQNAVSTTTSSASAASASASGSVKVLVVKVSNEAGGLVFEPNDVKANAGDMVQFQFYPKNHSVAMSNFAQPCVPIEQSNPNSTQKFFSGYMPTTQMGLLTYTIQVPDTKPIWFYCSQAKHCQSGMVGAINAPSTGNTLAAFTSKAAQAAANITPGQVEGGSTSSSSTSSGSSSSSSSGSSGSGTSTTPSASTPGVAQATGNSANSAHGSVLGAGLVAVFAWFML